MKLGGVEIGGLVMKRHRLAEKLIDFCLTNRLFSEGEMVNVSVDIVAEELQYSWFVENMIQTLIFKASNLDNIDLVTLKEIFIELEELRFELENTEQ